MVAAVVLVEVSVTPKELSRELITDTVELPIKTVPSRGVLVGTETPGVPDALESAVLAEPIASGADVGEVVAVDAVDVVGVEVTAVVDTENPGTTLRLGVSKVST